LFRALTQAEKPVAPKVVPCPRCGRDVEWTAASVYRPFCSARCKGIDLGAWANEEYRVAGTSDINPEDSTDTDKL
jgi:endogenous inhibitor of DNA gyrase (YacG/DUF329 family)